MRAIRILIVDDVPEVRQGLRALLPLAGEAAGLALEIVGEAGNGNEAIEQTIALGPDVVLMDIEMPEMDGCAATRVIKTANPSPRVVALTVHGDPATCRKAWEAGVDEFVEKGAAVETLIRAICGNVGENLKGVLQ